MTVRLSEIQITKVTDASTPLLFSGDAFVFDSAKAGGDVSPYMEYKLKGVLISGVIANGDDTAVDPNNLNVDLSASGDDGGIIINWFPTETVTPTESLDDGGMIIYGFPTETVRPIESVHHFELLI